MTFWETLNNHPYLGFFSVIFAIGCASAISQHVVTVVAQVLVARITGHAVCELEHVEDLEDDTTDE
jgi:hypothetical protein